MDCSSYVWLTFVHKTDTYSLTIVFDILESEVRYLLDGTIG